MLILFKYVLGKLGNDTFIIQKYQEIKKKEITHFRKNKSHRKNLKNLRLGRKEESQEIASPFLKYCTVL